MLKILLQKRISVSSDKERILHDREISRNVKLVNNDYCLITSQKYIKSGI